MHVKTLPNPQNALKSRVLLLLLFVAKKFNKKDIILENNLSEC